MVFQRAVQSVLQISGPVRIRGRDFAFRESNRTHCRALRSCAPSRLRGSRGDVVDVRARPPAAHPLHLSRASLSAAPGTTCPAPPTAPMERCSRSSTRPRRCTTAGASPAGGVLGLLRRRWSLVRACVCCAATVPARAASEEAWLRRAAERELSSTLRLLSRPALSTAPPLACAARTGW